MLRAPLTLVAAIVLAWGVEAGPASPPLPAPIRSLLDAHYTGWRIPAMNEETAASWRETFPGAPENVLQADYDADGRGDYAVLVEYPAPTEDGRVLPHRRALAFLRRRETYRMYTVTDPAEAIAHEGIHIWPAAKGERVYDLNVDREVVLERDGLLVNNESGGCATFVFRADAFVGLWTCD
jgi:hypothetical protein